MQHSIGMRPETWTKENIRKGEMAAMKCPECGRESHTGTVCACCGAILPRYDPFRELGDIIPKENETADKQPEVYFAEKKQNVSTDVDCFTGLGDLVDDKTLLNDNEEKCNSEVDLYGNLAGRDAFNSLGDLDDETTDKIEVDFACENINYGHSSEDNDDRDVRRGSKMILRWKRWSLAAACLAVIVAVNSGMTLLDLQKQIAQGDVQQPIDTIGPNEVQLSDTCDYILSYGVDAEGNKYELVANQRESALGYEITVGIIKNNTWLYPMSTEFPFLDQEDNLFHVSVDGAGNSGYSLDMYSAIIDNIYFVDVGAFAMDSYHETNSWIETYDHTFIFFSCSTMESKVIDLKEYQLELVATKNDRQIYTDNGQILIWTEDVVDTGILSYDYFYDWCLLDAETLSITTIGSRIKDCSPSSILAEGLIFASDKCFYNTDMQKVIDLSQYNIDMYYDFGIYFKNGQCTFKAKNKLGHEYEITIDIHGNVLSEVPIG